MANVIYLENYCKANGSMIATNGKVKDVASQAKTKNFVLYKGSTPEHHAFYDNASGMVGMIQVPAVMTPELKTRILTEFTNGNEIIYVIPLETQNYNGSGYINGIPDLEVGGEITLEFIKLNPKNQ